MSRACPAQRAGQRGVTQPRLAEDGLEDQGGQVERSGNRRGDVRR
jgi:hypothetical protein